MYLIDWVIVVAFLFFLTVFAFRTRKYTKSVSDFLAANRCAGRYLICVAGGMSTFGAISFIGLFEMYYEAGFSGAWWMMVIISVVMIIAVSGWVVYRYRETRAMTMAQFFEMRYNKGVRIFAGILAWLSGLINFGIFPAVGARFFIYYCGLPENIPGIAIPTYPVCMFVLLAISLFYVFLGGQVTVMITDFIQGVFVNVALLVILFLLLIKFNWFEIIDTLKMAPSDASLIHPFHASKVEGFNFFFFFIQAFAFIYGYMAWQGSQGYHCSAKNPHEARMGKILGEWRGLLLTFLTLLIPIACYVILHNSKYSHISIQVSERLSHIENNALQNQMRVPIVLTYLLPKGIIGLFAAVMLAAFITTHNTYLHSWGSIFIQDVILPFKKRPFTPKQHMWLLRFSIIFVAVFIFFFSLLFKQNEHILMFMAITGSIYIGGVGSLIVGGLYWKKGTTLGAWVALFIGLVMSLGGMILRQVWSSVYNWLELNSNGVLDFLTNLLNTISNTVPGINWEMNPNKFPIDSQWIYFFTIVSCLLAYILFSLLENKILRRPAFNINKLLHRGKYAVKGDHNVDEMPATGLKVFIARGTDFTLGDKFIFYAKIIWIMLWISVFVVGTIINLFMDVTEDGWARYWKCYVTVMTILGIVTTIWFSIGGIKDIKYLFLKLREIKRDFSDDGRVKN